jgi:hypothetical protein
MFNLFTHIAIALNLITAPVHDVDAAPTADLVKQYKGVLSPLWEEREVLKGLAVQLEILDPRECRYYFIDPDYFGVDLQSLRRRHRELKGAPLLADCNMFPPREVIADLLSLNRSWRQHMSDWADSGTWHAEEIHQAIDVGDEYYRLWDFARDARCDYYYVSVRRKSLLNLRNAIGNIRYYANQMPPPVPLQYFHDID